MVRAEKLVVSDAHNCAWFTHFHHANYMMLVCFFGFNSLVNCKVPGDAKTMPFEVCFCAALQSNRDPFSVSLSSYGASSGFFMTHALCHARILCEVSIRVVARVLVSGTYPTTAASDISGWAINKASSSAGAT
ncbi:hypothetical protein NC651_000451 [Populus alba x Populus x berolinensis]|nr:hypothetical protein NC651_000451 [Populus alba x Populus x berolinensis]